MIKLTITTKNGTTVSLDIPDTEDMTVTNSRVEQASAVVYPVDEDRAEEEPILREGCGTATAGPVINSIDDMIDAAFGSPKTLKKVAEMVYAHENTIGEKEEVGEVGGEEGGCKGEEGEAEGKEEEKPERIYDLEHTVETALDLFQFPCESGVYVPPMQLTRDFVLAFGEEHVTKEFLKARSWLIANPLNRKTQRGMGRFLNAWLCREAGMKRISVKEAAIVKTATKTGSLLDNGNQDSQGW